MMLPRAKIETFQTNLRTMSRTRQLKLKVKALPNKFSILSNQGPAGLERRSQASCPHLWEKSLKRSLIMPAQQLDGSRTKLDSVEVMKIRSSNKDKIEVTDKKNKVMRASIYNSKKSFPSLKESLMKEDQPGRYGMIRTATYTNKCTNLVKEKMLVKDLLLEPCSK
jgi:hypothetical protein